MDIVQLALIVGLLWIAGPFVIRVLRDIAIQARDAFRDVKGN